MYDIPDFDKYDEPRLHMQKLLSAKLIEFDLSLRILIPLESAGIIRLRDIVFVKKEQLLSINRIGLTAIRELEALLERLDLSFDMDKAIAAG